MPQRLVWFIINDSQVQDPYNSLEMRPEINIDVLLSTVLETQLF